eukprot:10894141-Karenia_brevis.AAC.1
MSSISRGSEAWALQAQRSTSRNLRIGRKGVRCKISKKTAVIGSRKRLVELYGRHLEKIGLKAKTPKATRDYIGGIR